MIWKNRLKIPQEIRNKFTDLDEISAQMAFNRGLENINDVYNFLNPILEVNDSLTELNDVDKAVQVILDKVFNKEKVFIYGDYDVDGICATSILFDFLYRKLKADVVPYIPSRFEEGYGINANAIQQLQKDGAGLIISVDCGIRDGKILEENIKNGTDIIITDHHQTPENAKDLEVLTKIAKAVVHPLLNDYPFKEICATTVVWHLVYRLSLVAGQRGMLISEFNHKDYLDLVALATVCDVMPLVDQNRVILKLGLTQMNKTSNPGLKELLIISGIYSEEILPFHLGYIIGPRLNAAGRLDTALEAVRLLTSKNQSQITELAKKLSDLNTTRQELTKELIHESEKKLEEWGKDKKIIIIVGEEWQEGLVGLVAGRLCEKYHKPVIVMSLKNGTAVGSCRSIASYHITKAISKYSKLLVRFGGHAQAAGLTIEENNIHEFSESLLEDADQNISDTDLEKVLNIEYELSSKDLDKSTLEKINRFAPFGFGNSEPIFSIKNVEVKSVKRVGANDDHIKLSILKDGTYLDAIGFKLGEQFGKINKGDMIDIAGYLDLNKFMGQESLQIKIVDIKNE